MSDIFISYASADRSRIRPLVDALRKQGWSVWWDRSILPGKAWENEIEKALLDTKCVIVLWSQNSIQSDWVRTEANDARQRGILVPALLDDVTIPLAFRRFQAANLVDWSGALPFAGFEELAKAVSEVLAGVSPGASAPTIEPASKPSAGAEGGPVEDGSAPQKAGEVSAPQETNGCAKEELAAPRAAAMTRADRPSFASARTLAIVRKRVIIFGLPAATLIGIVVYTQTHKGDVEPPSSKQNSGAALSLPNPEKSPAVEPKLEHHEKDQLEKSLPPAPKPSAPIPSPTPVRPLAAGEVRENPKDGLAYVWIPPGRFVMGCSQGDDDCGEDEEPSHPVSISKGFWMGQTEVTQGAYQHVMNENRSHFDGALAAIDAFGFQRTNAQTRMIRAQLPVESVNWNEASQYCQKVGLRLPTEAEWEYAGRAGTVGAQYGDLDNVAWYGRLNDGITMPVHGKQPSPWGLYDMLGNVEEWTADWFGRYQSGEARDPKGPPSGAYRIIRGATGTSAKVWSASPVVAEPSTQGVTRWVFGAPANCGRHPRISQIDFLDTTGSSSPGSAQTGGDLFLVENFQ